MSNLYGIKNIKLEEHIRLAITSTPSCLNCSYFQDGIDHCQLFNTPFAVIEDMYFTEVNSENQQDACCGYWKLDDDLPVVPKGSAIEIKSFAELDKERIDRMK